jgi:hypothetical protein
MVTSEVAWDQPTAEDETELHVAAFYEDLTSGEWAKEIFDRIRRRMSREINATPRLWRFDVLQNEDFAAAALADTAEAAVIIVAARGTRPLPERVLHLLEQALMKHRRGRVGLVAVLEQTDQITKERSPAYRQLQAVSRNAKTRLFALPSSNAMPTLALDESAQFAPRSLLYDSHLVEIGPYRAWGINE